jgi:hypothetical protein
MPGEPVLDRDQPAAIPSRRWAEVPASSLDDVHGVMTDIDDTLTAAGRLDPPAATALLRLRRDPAAASYWVPREDSASREGAMKDQF